MSGLYIHVPFCEKRCLYCDFYSNTDSRYKASYLEALIQEMEMRKGYLQDEPLETIYLGGGTPSQLSVAELERIFEAIYRNFRTTGEMEITLEANPDDMTPGYVEALQSLPVNRISMGVQSFDKADLKFLNRRHDKAEAVRAVALCQKHHLYNISIDLIYGLPEQTAGKWEKNLTEALRLDIPHISAYHIIYEEGTPLYRLLQSGEIHPVDEDTSLTLFSILIDRLAGAGFEQYEISNFARPGYYSRHNSSYWQGKRYLGLGPSAHSYDGTEREWNVSSLAAWLKGIRQGVPALEKEPLDLNTRYNDYIITRLRTKWGIDLSEVSALFGPEKLNYCLKMAKRHEELGLLLQKDNNIALTRKGIFVSDSIMSDLLWV